MIYVPEYTNGNCAIVQDSNTIRVYDTTPTANSTVNYIDYYINSHYLFKKGTQTFNNYVHVPTCSNSDYITTNFYYRNDIFEIIATFILIVGFIWFFISNLSKLLFRGRRRY